MVKILGSGFGCIFGLLALILNLAAGAVTLALSLVYLAFACIPAILLIGGVILAAIFLGAVLA